MPIVTVDVDNFERFELKSAPPDGYVMLRPLPYGMKLARRDKALKMQMISQKQKRGQRASDEQRIDLETLNEWATMYDFNYCIGDHNLQTKDGSLVDFNNPRTIELVFKSLDPKVGDEISDLIDKLNEDMEEVDLEDFMQQRGSLLETELKKSLPDSHEQ